MESHRGDGGHHGGFADHADARPWYADGPHWDSSVIWDGWILMLPGVFVAAVLATALALNGPGEALWSWVRAQWAPDPWRARWDAAVAQPPGHRAGLSRVRVRPGCAPAAACVGRRERAGHGRFVDAFAEANALRTEQFPGPEYAQRFVTAVERAEQGWDAAVEAAGRKRDARFDPEERRMIAQVETLLGVAASSPFESERRTAYRKAQRRLADLERRTGWRLPRTAAAALEQRARGVLLPAAE